MSRNKKPVVVVAVCLGVLIILPLLLVLVSNRSGNHSGSASPGVPSDAGSRSVKDVAVADYELSQLADRAKQLLEEDLAEALRKGDVSLDFVAELNRQFERGRNDLNGGRLRRARERFSEFVAAVESKLEEIAVADQARALRDSTYAELQRLEYLRPAFENTYREAVENYNQALRELEASNFPESVARFELSSAILGDLEARAIQQIATLLESAKASLEKYELAPAREAYEAVLGIDVANADATDGLTMVTALEGIADRVKAIRDLENQGKLEEALSALELLAAEHPQNPFIKSQRESIEARLVQRDFDALVESSTVAENAGDYATAIADLEAALKLLPDAVQQLRLAEIEEKYKAARLETLLADGFQALKDGRYEAARNLYKEAVGLDPDSKEARTGLEKASGLYLANIRYSQNIRGVERYIGEGRFPLATKLFNEAMGSRPANIVSAQEKKEDEIRSALKAQNREVDIRITSDNRTFVSIIGVLPPDRLKSMDLKLYPDVYKVRGTRKGYRDVEIDLKVDATNGSQTINIQCTQKI